MFQFEVVPVNWSVIKPGLKFNCLNTDNLQIDAENNTRIVILDDTLHLGGGGLRGKVRAKY